MLYQSDIPFDFIRPPSWIEEWIITIMLAVLGITGYYALVLSLGTPTP